MRNARVYNRRSDVMSALLVLLLLCAHSSTAAAFVVRQPSTRYTVSCSKPSTELFGVRSAIREHFRKYRDSYSSKQQKQATEQKDTKGSVPLPHQQQVKLEEPPVGVAVLDEEVNIQECAIVHSFVLPPRDETKLTQYEKEFRTMMEEVESYTDRCVQSVADPKSRAIFAGARAGAAAPEVYRAFEILFQDLVAVRIAGRMIFKKLSQVMRESRDNHQQQVITVASTTGLSASEVESGRFAFLSVADYKNDGDTVLNLDQLVETGVATTVVEMLGYEDFDDFISNCCKEKRCELKFDEMMIALQHCPAGSSAAECTPHLVLQEIASRMNSTEATASVRKTKYAKRYDEMVESFAEWERYMPSEGKSRWFEVLRGCFVGAKIDEVVAALKIVYVDYSALRLAGDTIYGIMGKLIRKKSS